jgi:osmotically-inducible protein OsmY
MKGAWKASVIVLLWLLNLAACLTITSNQIQGDLETRIKRALAENALDDWKVSASGMDITLTGPPLKDGNDRNVNEEAATEVVQSVAGVRGVSVRYPTAGKAAGAAQVVEWFQITRLSGQEVILRGAFMNIEERDAVHEILEDWFSGLLVSNLADFGANTRGSFDVNSAVKAQLWMKRTADFNFKVQGGKVLIEGIAASPKDRQAITEQVRRSFRKLPISNKMTVQTAALIQGSPVQVTTSAPTKKSNWSAFNRREADLFEGTKLSEKGKAHFDRIVQFFKDDAKLRLRIGVHTDKTGALQETQSRAQSIKNYLVQRGIKAQRFQAMGLGSRVPAESGFHRRVTFQAL